MARYSKEFKLEAIRVLNEKVKPIAELAKELGVKRTLLYRWRAELNRKSEAKAFNNEPWPKQKKSDELRRLRKENESLKEDLEILKKAAAYFARDLK
jgi:transposase